MTQEQLSTDEVGRRLRVGLVQVYDLFNELHDLFRLMHQVLKESDSDIHPLTSKGFLLPKERKGSKPADRLMKTDMGLLAEIGVEAVDDEDEEEEGQEEGLDEEGDEEGLDAVETDKKIISITPEQRFLGIRAILLDPKTEAQDPTVVAGIFGSLTLTQRSRRNRVAASQNNFTIRRVALKRLVKLLTPGLAPGRTLSHRVKNYGHLEWTIAAIHHQPLATFGSRADVDTFVGRVVEMVAE